MGIGATTNNGTGTPSTTELTEGSSDTSVNTASSADTSTQGVDTTDSPTSPPPDDVSSNSNIDIENYSGGSSTDYNSSDINSSTPDDKSISDDKGNTWKTFDDLLNDESPAARAQLLAMQPDIPLAPVFEPTALEAQDNTEEDVLSPKDVEKETNYLNDLSRAQHNNRTRGQSLLERGQKLFEGHPLRDVFQSKGKDLLSIARDQEKQLQQRLSDTAKAFANKYNAPVDPKAQKMVFAQAQAKGSKQFFVKDAALATAGNVIEKNKKEALKNQQEAQKAAQKNTAEQAKAEKETKKAAEQEAKLAGGEEVTPEKLKEVEQKVQKYVGGDVASRRLANLKTKDGRLKARLQKMSEARSFMKNGATNAMKQGAARMIRDFQREGFSALLGGHHGLADDAFDFGVAQACPDLQLRPDDVSVMPADGKPVSSVFNGTPEEAMLKLGRMTGLRGEKPEYLGKNSGVAVLNYFNCWVPPSEREETYVSQLQSGAGVA